MAQLLLKGLFSLKTVNSKKIGKKRALSFYMILIILPFILLLGMEFLLRIGGYGKDIPLFIRSEQFKNYLQPNPNIIQRYFPNPELAPDVSPDTEFFKKNKPNNSFRIVIQGGSSAAGFPYGRWGSIKGMLDQRFKRLYPNRNIEIINTAMSAVNTYTLLDFVDEIIQQKPDLILIYSGHNEYLGIMGVGSAFASHGGRSATLLSLKFKSLRLYQLIENIFYSNNDFTKKDTQSRTLMSQIAKQKNIPYDSEMYHAGVEQFSENLSLILAKYQHHNIAVMISTLVSNEQDQPPFSSIGNYDWDSFKLKLNHDKISISLEQAKKQFKLSNSAADAFILAQMYLTKGYLTEARIFFQKARDLDPLRFRAPTEFNQVIKNVANNYGAELVDAEAYFIEHSSNGIPGSDLILEHLHPNTTGYFYLAEAFSDAISKKQLLGKSISKINQERALDDIPVSKSDQLFGQFKIKKLTSGYPFTVQTVEVIPPSDTSIETKALNKRLHGESWLSLQQQLLVQYQKLGDFKEAAKIASLICDAIPEQHQTAYIAGQLYFKVKDFEMAQYYHKLAINISPQNIQYLLSLAQDLFTANKLFESLDTLKLVLEIEPKHKTALFYIAKIKQQLKGIHK